MAINIFGAPPDYLSGLLGVDPEKLQKQAMTTGLINTALAFAAQPRNQGYGSVLPYAARALMAGQQGAQGVYQGALQDFQTKQKIEEIKRQQEQQQAQQAAISELPPDMQRLYTGFGQAAVPSIIENLMPKPVQRETFVAPDGSIRFKDTGEIAQKDIVRAPKDRETMMAPNGILIYKDTGEPVTQRSFAAPKEPKEVKLYGDTPIPTASGYVFMPTAEGMARGLQPRKIEGVESPEQAKQAELQRKQVSGKEAKLETATTVKNTISKATNILNKPYTATSGLVGSVASVLKRPDRLALEGYIDTLKSNLSFDALQAMRDASPTGGALGSIAVEELRLLGSTVASLNPDLPADVLKENLNEVLTRYAKIESAIKQDLGMQNDNLPNGVSQEIWNAMTPQERALWK